MYEIFNSKVLEGAPYSTVLGLVKKHGRETTAQQARGWMLELAADVKRRSGSVTVLSTGCRPKLCEALKHVPVYKHVLEDTYVVANDFETMERDLSRIQRFDYDGIDVAGELAAMMQKRQQDPGEVMYVGHDYRDWETLKAALGIGARGAVIEDGDPKFIEDATALGAEVLRPHSVGQLAQE